MPDEVMVLIVQRCSESLLLALRASCRSYLELASDDGIWRSRAEATWEGKDQNVLLTGWFSTRPWWKAYYGSLRDSTRRQLSPEEISTAKSWCVRFKAAAGPMWMQRDPWWQGRPPIKLRLELGGNTVAVNDTRPFYGATGHISGHWSSRMEPSMGTTIVEANEQPPYKVYRHAPTWGIYMESCWQVWTAFDMPPRGECPELEDDMLHVLPADPTQLSAVEACSARMRTRSWR